MYFCHLFQKVKQKDWFSNWSVCQSRQFEKLSIYYTHIHDISTYKCQLCTLFYCENIVLSGVIMHATCLSYPLPLPPGLKMSLTIMFISFLYMWLHKSAKFYDRFIFANLAQRANLFSKCYLICLLSQFSFSQSTSTSS